MPNCRNCKTEFRIDESDMKFYEKVSPILNGQKYLLPPPTLCPDCRQQRRLAHCNEFHLYQANCDLCKKPGLTEHSPSEKHTNYCKECWHSDKWDPKDYGKDFDFSRPFFEQFDELCRSAPLSALIIDGTNINC